MKATSTSFDRVIFDIDGNGIHTYYKSIENVFQSVPAVMELLLENFTIFSLNFAI